MITDDFVPHEAVVRTEIAEDQDLRNEKALLLFGALSRQKIQGKQVEQRRRPEKEHTQAGIDGIELYRSPNISEIQAHVLLRGREFQSDECESVNAEQNTGNQQRKLVRFHWQQTDGKTAGKLLHEAYTELA